MISQSRAPDLVWPNTCRCVLVRYYTLMRSVAIGCEFGLNVCPDHDKGNYDLATIGLDRHIHSKFDYRHLPPDDWLVGWLVLNVPVNKFFCHVWTEPPLSGYYQYFWGVNVPCSRTQHGLTRVGLEPPTSGPGVRGINHQATPLPYLPPELIQGKNYNRRP